MLTDANIPSPMPNLLTPDTLSIFLSLLPIQPVCQARILKYRPQELKPFENYTVLYLLTSESGEVIYIGHTTYTYQRLCQHASKPHMYIHALCFEAGHYNKLKVKFIEQIAISFFFPSMNNIVHTCPYDLYKDFKSFRKRTTMR